MSCKKNKVLSLVFGVSALMSLNSHAWGPTHYHGGGYGPGYYGPGYPGGWWGGPNLVINVPIVPVVPAVPYVRECETVQICNQYDECWLERQCR